MTQSLFTPHPLHSTSSSTSFSSHFFSSTKSPLFIQDGFLDVRAERRVPRIGERTPGEVVSSSSLFDGCESKMTEPRFTGSQGSLETPQGSLVDGSLVDDGTGSIKEPRLSDVAGESCSTSVDGSCSLSESESSSIGKLTDVDVGSSLVTG